MVDEAERSLHDALCVLSQTVKETRIVLGGGCSEMLMSCAIENEARSVTGKRALAVESFSRALRMIPTILADNAGYDSSDLVSRLRAAHYKGQSDSGLGKSSLHRRRISLMDVLADMDAGTIGSMRQKGVTESYKLKRQVVISASEAAEMIMRYDQFVPTGSLSSPSFIGLITSCGPPQENVRACRTLAPPFDRCISAL
jgi:T-complex protein 1 subunit beta